MIHDETKEYEWDAMEFEHREKSVDWYWALGIAVVIGVILCIISKNYLLAILLIMGGGMIGFYANEKPLPVRVEISERGIKMNQDLYTYESISSFWMYKDHRNHNRLIIVTSRAIMPQRIVTLPDNVSFPEMRNYLTQYITEKETHPSLIDLLAELFGL